MKNTLKIVAVVMMLVMTVLVFASCSKYNAIKSDFEDAGYAVNEDAETTGEIETDDGVITYTIHTFQKENDGGLLGSIGSALSTAVVWEFSSDADLTKAMTESEEMMQLLEDAQESELVNGNCFLMTINPEAVEIFNASK